MNTTPASSHLIELLLRIWEKVLAVKPIAASDDFFALGGEQVAAGRLFDEIRELTGQDFPAVSIYHMRTPGSMADVLRQTGPFEFSQPVLLKHGTRKPPVFLAHGIGADLLHFEPLITGMRTDHPVYGIQSRGSYGIEKPHTDIAAMARYHLLAIRKTQPQGPYLLIGYSLGGLIMTEVARRLLEDGEKAPLLVMVDSYPYRTQLRAGQKMRLYGRLAARDLIRRMGLGGAVSKPAPLRPEKHSAQTEDEPLADSQAARVNPSTAPTETEKSDRASAYQALKTYQPRFYPGPIQFVRASVVTDFPTDASKVWGHLVGQLQVETIPGDHLDLLSTSAPELARTLSRYLERIDAAR